MQRHFRFHIGAVSKTRPCSAALYIAAVQTCSPSASLKVFIHELPESGRHAGTHDNPDWVESGLMSLEASNRDSTYERCSKASEEGMVGSFSEQGSGGSSDAAHTGVHCYAQPQCV